MSFTDYNVLGTIGHDLFVVAGSFVADTSADAVTSVKGFGGTPAWVSDTSWTITCDEVYPAMISCQVGWGGAVAQTAVQYTATYSAGVITLTLRSAAAGSAAAPGDETTINYLAVFQRKSAYGTV